MSCANLGCNHTLPKKREEKKTVIEFSTLLIVAEFFAMFLNKISASQQKLLNATVFDMISNFLKKQKEGLFANNLKKVEIQ